MRLLIAFLLSLTVLLQSPAVIIVHGPRTASAASSTLLTDLISYWKMDEASGTRADSVTGSANDLTDNNTVASTTGKISNAGSYVAANSEYLSRASNSSLQCGDIDFTFSCWIYSTAWATASLVTKDDDAASSRDYTVDISTNVPRFYINGSVFVSGPASLSDSNWYFIVAWHDAAANTVNIQVNNGTVQSTGTSGEVPHTSSAQFRIGAREYASFPDYFTGIIDEVGFWKRVLTADERTALYNAGSGLSYPF
jgi:hypothetical protein